MVGRSRKEAAQTIKTLAALNIKEVQQTTRQLLRNSLHDGAAQVLFSLRSETRAQTLKLASGFDDGACVGGVARQQIFQRGDIIQASAAAHYGAQIGGRQVLIKHQQVVAKIEESLARVFHSQSAATHVVDDALRNADHFSSARIQAPTEVDLFHMGKEALIKPSGRQPISAANHQSSARRPKYGTNVVILPAVALDHRKDASATKRITIAIQIAARSLGWQAATSGCASI